MPIEEHQPPKNSYFIKTRHPVDPCWLKKAFICGDGGDDLKGFFHISQDPSVDEFLQGNTI